MLEAVIYISDDFINGNVSFCHFHEKQAIMEYAHLINLIHGFN